MRSVAIRFAATFCFLRVGFWEIPENFRRTLFVIDLWHPAELIPGYEGDFPNTSTEVLNVSAIGVEGKISKLLGYVVYFFPAYLYRLSIKSTCWLYLPLVYIAIERDSATTPVNFFDRIIEGGWEPWRRFLALATLIAFSATTLASFAVQDMRGRVTDKIISPIEFMFQFDFTGKWWQYCSLAGAVITFWIWLEAKDLRIDFAHAHDAPSQARVAKQVDRAKLMMRVRNVASAAVIGMIGVHALLAYSPVAKYLPATILRGLTWFYGAYMPPIPAAP